MNNLGSNGIGITASKGCDGRIPIWLDPAQAKQFSLESGFTILNRPLAPSVVPVGTPIAVNEADRTANICYRFEVYEDATDTATAIKIKKDNEKYGKLAKVGMNIMKQPAAIDGTGAAYPIASIDVSNAGYDIINLGTTLGVALTAGDVLAEGDGTGASGVSLLHTITHVAYAGIYVESDSENMFYTVTATYGGRIYDRRIRKIAAVEKAIVEDIIFTQLK